MAGEWKETALGDVIELKRGYDLPQQQRRPGRVPLVSSSGVTDYHAVAMVKGPGVVTGRSVGATGKDGVAVISGCVTGVPMQSASSQTATTKAADRRALLMP